MSRTQSERALNMRGDQNEIGMERLHGAERNVAAAESRREASRPALEGASATRGIGGPDAMRSRPPAGSNPTAARRLVEAARGVPLDDGGLRARALLTEALAADRSCLPARALRDRLDRSRVPRWHFSMLADAPRNASYAEAIAELVRPGDLVLDIGTGAGLTAMMAARAGAGHVYSCEAEPLIAENARRVVAANGLADRITILPIWAHQIEVGAHLPAQADVLISEIVDGQLLGEGALPTLDFALTRLAAPHARIAPLRGALYAQPIECAALFELWRPRDIEGFDLAEFGAFADRVQMSPAEIDALAPRALGPRTPLFSFDFHRPHAPPARVEARLPCAQDGTAHATLLTFDLEVAPGLTISSALGGAAHHWARTAFLEAAPRRVRAGEALAVVAEHDRTDVVLTLGPHDPSDAEPFRAC